MHCCDSCEKLEGASFVPVQARSQEGQLLSNSKSCAKIFLVTKVFDI